MSDDVSNGIPVEVKLGCPMCATPLSFVLSGKIDGPSRCPNCDIGLNAYYIASGPPYSVEDLVLECDGHD